MFIEFDAAVRRGWCGWLERSTSSLAALNGTYGTDVANSSDHCRSGKSARRSGLGSLSAPSSWCRAEGQKVPTVVPYDRDKVSLLPEGVSLVNLESTLGDYAREHAG